jgi:hypothetical protein
MQIGIHAFQISQSHMFTQSHLVEAGDKVGVEEPTMEDRQA